VVLKTISLPCQESAENAPQRKIKSRPDPLSILDQYLPNGFQLSIQQKGAEIFSITLDRLDHIIEDQKPDPIL
jgi:hypothetical protein